jgi:hypothetical protein
MQGLARGLKIRLLTLIAVALLVVAGLLWWLQSNSAKSPRAHPVDGSQPNSGDKGALRLGFGQGLMLAEQEAAEGCIPAPLFAEDVGDSTASKALAARVVAANEQLQATLLQSAGARQQALGLMLQSTGVMSTQHRDDYAALDALARLAAASSDPVVYAMALRSCSRAWAGPSEGGCSEISERGWAQIDPGNAVPWLDLAGEASERDDAAAEAEALHQAASALHVDSDTDSLLAVAQPAMPPGLTPLEQYYVNVRLIGFQAALPLSYYRAVRDCSSAGGDGDGNAESWSDCSAVAQLMVASGRNLLDFSFGLQLGEKLGWPAQRVADLRRERSALMMVELGRPRDLSVPLSCHDAIREMERVRRWSATGELSALRMELRTSGLSVEELATQYEQWEASASSKVRAAAQQATQ